MSEWNPDLYLKFEKERTQPVKDLIFRIEKENPNIIIDIGCGPGNSTNELKTRWGSAHIIGLDSSKAMLEKAQKEYREFHWIQADAREDLSFLGTFDIVFSNAVIQWIPEHKELVKRLFRMVNHDGVLAIQLPNVRYMPINIAVLKTAEEDKWRNYFRDMAGPMYYEELGYYYNALSPLTQNIVLWETQYHHVLPGHDQIIEWYKSTGMKPYLEKISEQKDKDEFVNSVLSKIRDEYKMQKNGNVLFPFRRLFFIAYK